MDRTVFCTDTCPTAFGFYRTHLCLKTGFVRACTRTMRNLEETIAQYLRANLHKFKENIISGLTHYCLPCRRIIRTYLAWSAYVDNVRRPEVGSWVTRWPPSDPIAEACLPTAYASPIIRNHLIALPNHCQDSGEACTLWQDVQVIRFVRVCQICAQPGSHVRSAVLASAERQMAPRVDPTDA